MLSLHALLIFIFCASAVAPPPPLLHGARTPYPPPKIPGKAKRPFYRVNIPPNVTPESQKEYMNDIMILGEGLVELWQLTAEPGVLENKRVLQNTQEELIRLRGDWILFPTGEIRDKDCEMVRVDVEPGLVVTCGLLVQEGEWGVTRIDRAVAGHEYYYFHSHIFRELIENNLEILYRKDVVRIIPKETQVQFLIMPAVDAKHEAPLIPGRVTKMEVIRGRKLIPFPVKIDDVEKLATRNQLFNFVEKNGLVTTGVTRLTFKPLDGEIGH